MSFFTTFLKNNNIPQHDGKPLWKYMLNDVDYNKLYDELSNAEPVSIDPRDVTLYYAEWWKKNYHGGKPSKQEIFDSLNRNEIHILNHEDLFKLAKNGARMLGVRWITKQNTLYFRTLLLQGGLPLAHISENQGHYQAFLLAVLEEQPETIEDFIFKPHITSLLPESSQNEIIYENCFEIVKSILNDENIYDDLFSSNKVLTTISENLRIRKNTLERRHRFSKPKNYWILNFKNESTSINLRLGLADTYTPKSLSNILGFEANGREYQFYVNEELICVFRKMINGNFKTDWYHQQNQEWNGESNLPYAYIIYEGIKREVPDFIETIPNLDEPSLWAKFDDNEWRLIRGNGTSNQEAAILFPPQWHSDLQAEKISVHNKQLSWLIFEGKVEINLEKECREYLSQVNSIDWTIVSQKPEWILKAGMPVVQRKPHIIIYDENNDRLPDNRSRIWIKSHNSDELWQEFSGIKKLEVGCIDVKIEKDGLTAYDMFFNIGNLQAKYSNQNIDSAKIEIINTNNFEFRLDESEILEIQHQNNTFTLTVNTKYSRIPIGLKGSLGKRNQRMLYFETTSPFRGMTITNGNGKIIATNEILTLSNLYGLRILSTPNNGTILRMRNRLKPDVIISKELNISSQPVISFKDEILRLYYLADAMDYRNRVCLELVEGRNSITYEIAGFSHALNVEEQFQNNVRLFPADNELDLFAVPLNCPPEMISLIPLVKNESSYTIPHTEGTNQFVVISSEKDGNQLMPRYVNTDENFEGIGKEVRIENYHKELLKPNFHSQIWKQLSSYFEKCIENEIPFSTFDQIRAISRSSIVAARAFFFLGINQEDTDYFIQKTIPEMEKDLGFSFHWIKKEDWIMALEELSGFDGIQLFEPIFGLLSKYMQNNGLVEVLRFITGVPVEIENIHLWDIRNLCGQLGERVLNELPEYHPRITGNHGLPYIDPKANLLLRAPIAVAESINNTQLVYPIWAGDDFRDTIRRNIQYSQYLNPEFYNRVILQVLINN